ncbi:MAG: ABC-F family ATP-binding cassette domain-containing protein [Elusimicrobia bacterium]|nr:ABC-F family ATP-binding cassette domain-containing protein [Elusimicrobiota bacterium]
MAILLSCQELAKSFGARPLFTGLSFGLFEGERTGLIGPNGTGKSTLLRILAGLETPDSGSLAPRRGLRVGYLAQQDRVEEAPPGLTVRDRLAAGLADLGLEDHEIGTRISAGMDRAGFGDPAQEVAKLSGGWRKRLGILAATLREPDLLLLDEPTNHLDLEGVLWLEKLLTGLSFSFLVVTHDRRFLERVCTRMIELDRRYPSGHFSSSGSYTKFLENREIFLDAQAAREDSLRNIVRSEIEWLRRGARARTTKQKAHIDRAGRLLGELSELEYRNAQGRATTIDFLAGDRQANRLVSAAGVSKTLGGRRLFGPLDLALRPGDKLGLIGGNGSGKTTLLKILAGQLPADSGGVKLAEGLRVVVFDQHRDSLDPGLTLRRALCPAGEHVEYNGAFVHVNSWARRFLFRPEQLDMPLSSFSGGEQSRVMIAGLMRRPADLLLLDEPTNDLDIRSLEVLENSLKDFAGALVLVTHDRYLLDRVCGAVLGLDGRGGHGYFGGLEQWEDWQAGRDTAAAAAAAPAEKKAPALGRKEAEELRNMERTIKAAEDKVANAESALEDPAIATDAEELHRRQLKVDEARTRVAALFERWEELEARAREE